MWFRNELSSLAEVSLYLCILPSEYWITGYPIEDQTLKKLRGPHEKLKRPVTEIPSWFTPWQTCQTESSGTRVIIVALQRIESSISPQIKFSTSQTNATVHATQTGSSSSGSKLYSWSTCFESRPEDRISLFVFVNVSRYSTYNYARNFLWVRMCVCVCACLLLKTNA